MAISSTYNAGTASIANGATAVTGQGTTWLTSGLQAGDLFWGAGDVVRIQSVNSNTSITLAYAWPGATRTAAAYEVYLIPDAERVLATTMAMLAALANGNLSSIATLATAANKLAYYTAPGVGDLTDLTPWARGILGLSAAPWRERLTANRTYWVSTTGSDSNDGLNSGVPMLTLQKAFDAALSVDCAGFGVTIRLVDGGGYAGATMARSLFGTSSALALTGNNATPANVVLSGGILASGPARLAITGVKWAGAGITAVRAEEGARITLGSSAGSFEFGDCVGGVHMSIGRGGAIVIGSSTGSYKISGGATNHILALTPAAINISGVTVTLTGTPAFTDFINARQGGVVALSSLTFSGAATGRRYSSTYGAVIDTNGQTSTWLPGDTAGVTSNGGVYG